jgi:CRISPR-associated protein Csb2
VSVTPVALGLHAKAKLSEEEIVARHVRELGLPDPASVSLHNVSEAYGVPLARNFHQGEASALKGRVLRHAVLRFHEKVAGPLVVGAGRHVGFGLFLPRGDAS